MQTRKEKVKYLQDVMAGKVDVKLIENPLRGIDLNNLPCSTVEDFILLKDCCDFTRDNSYPQEKCDQLFEALVRAGINIGLVDNETEATWRHMRARSGKMYMMPIKASLFNNLSDDGKQD